jgi:glucose/arabinose dehydrogenase
LTDPKPGATLDVDTDTAKGRNRVMGLIGSARWDGARSVGPAIRVVIVATLAAMITAGAGGPSLNGTPGRAAVRAEATTTRVAAGAGSAASLAAAARRATVTTPLAPTSYSPGHLRLRYQRAASGLKSPVFVTTAGDSSGRLFVVEQTGRIKIISRGSVLSTPFLDLHTKISCCGERGLLGLAFHPSYRTNGKFYVDYTDRSGNTVVAEYRRSSTNSNRASTTGRTVLRVTQPYSNHNGGMLAFGSDGDLYIALGDGGGTGDPGNRAQNVSTKLGKLLRINVNGRDPGLPYAIPTDNPFVGKTGDDAVWSFGLRNPWRFSFDKTTRDLWIGDVGQDRFEEIDRATNASGRGNGVNFGWRVLEGRACYNPPTGCSSTGKTAPLAVYSHGFGCSVTGGYVYRGTKYPAMAGAYLFADYCSGRIWAVAANGAAIQSPLLISDTAFSISSFGQSQNGTLYVANHRTGAIYQLIGLSK